MLLCLLTLKHNDNGSEGQLGHAKTSKQGDKGSLCKLACVQNTTMLGVHEKNYTILSPQLLLTIAMVTIIGSIHPIAHFLVSFLAVFQIIFSFIMLCPLYHYSQKYPVNLFILAPFTLGISFSVGLTCVFNNVTTNAYKTALQGK